MALGSRHATTNSSWKVSSPLPHTLDRRELTLPPPPPTPAPHPPSHHPAVGTSDFDNMHQQLFLDKSWSGLAVEPLPELFAVLPRRPGLLRENAALGCGAGVRELSMLGVNRANQQAFGLPRWTLGTGTVVPDMQNRASHQLVYGDDWWDALVRTNVTCRSWADIAAKHGIRATRFIASKGAEEPGGPHFNIDVLKVDAEFADVLVLNEVLDWFGAAERALLGVADGGARAQRVVYPSQVVFEIFNEREGMSETLRARFLAQNVLLGRFYELGYECKFMDVSDVQCLLCSDSSVKCKGPPPPRVPLARR